jgi:sulfatase maturation enzyme AslB (radical SAM superfamily)
MSHIVKQILNLEEYQCRSCKRLFYINGMDRSSLDLDFGCPYGCDDNGRFIREVKARVQEVKQGHKGKGGSD